MSLLQSAYNRFLRERLPRKIVICNGVPTLQGRLLDRTIEIPEYEEELVEQLKQIAKEGDEVVIVGGGYGVSAVHAADYIGGDGYVTVFEASPEHINIIQQTLRWSDVEQNVDIKEAVVGGITKNVYGDSDIAASLDSSELPHCDILELDCEGAEITILENLSIKPRAIVVETHPHYDAPRGEVEELLHEQGYEVIREGTASEEIGIEVLTAVQK